MNDKFTVIDGGNNEIDEFEIKRVYRIAKINEAWERQLEKCVTSIFYKYGDKALLCDVDQHELMKCGLAGIKFICTWREIKRENNKLGIDSSDNSLAVNQWLFDQIENIFNMLGELTLKNFVITFPIDKSYDGDKWEEKDYFFTMEVLSKLDWDKPIGGENISDFLWDYQNRDLRNAYVEYMCAASALYKEQTGKGIAEQFCEDNGIGAYTMNSETGIIKDNKTGNTKKIKKNSHIRIVK